MKSKSVTAIAVASILTACAPRMRGRAIIESNKNTPSHLSYLSAAELSQHNYEQAPKGGRLRFKNSFIVRLSKATGDPHPYLIARRNGQAMRAKCSSYVNATLMQGMNDVRDVISSISCDVQDSIAGPFDVAILETDADTVETFRVTP